MYVIILYLSPKAREYYRVNVDKKQPRFQSQKSFVTQGNERRAEEEAARLRNTPLLQGEDAAAAGALTVREGEDETVTTGPGAGAGAPGDGGGKDDADEERGILGKISTVVCWPWNFLFRWTCPECAVGKRWEKLYPLTFFVSFIWVAVFSFMISAVVERWVNKTNLSGGFFGLFLVSMGAEIPDTIQSVTVARRGYGSMAVSNSIGSQIINILIGLGLPWTIANFASGDGGGVKLTGHKSLQVAAFFQSGAVVFNFVLLIGFALVQKTNKAVLSKWKGIVFIVMYIVIAIAYCIWSFTSTPAAGSGNATRAVGAVGVA